MIGDHRRERRVEMREPVGQGGLGVGLHLPVGDVADPAALDANDAPAGATERRVEAEDDHRIPFVSSERHTPTTGISTSAIRPKFILSAAAGDVRSEEHTSELQSLMRISYAVVCLKKKKRNRIK